jgi:type I restriction enzyme S subunit
MSKWKEEILSEHIGLRHGYQFRETDFTENGIQVIKIGNVTSDGLSLSSNVSYVSSLREKEFESIIIREGDILMSLTGNIGRVVEVKNLGNKILFQNYRVGVFYPLNDNISKPFLKWILSSEEILRQLNSNSNQSAQANFGKQDLDKLKFKIPSISEQLIITKILNAIEAVIEKTQNIIAKYKAVKQGMLNDLFTRGIEVKTGKLRPKKEDAPEFYKESELGWIPKEWDELILDECCEILDHLRVPVNGLDRQNLKGDIPYYGANGLQGYINDFIFNEDLILIAEDGGNFEEYDRRPIAYRISGKSWVNNHAHILKAKAEYSQDYIFYSLVHKNIVRFIAGGTRSKLNKSELIKIPIYRPQNPLEQQKIAERLNGIDQKIQSDLAYLNKLQQIKSGLMADLLSGENKLQ